jgi:hypothetical protein
MLAKETTVLLNRALLFELTNCAMLRRHAFWPSSQVESERAHAYAMAIHARH